MSQPSSQTPESGTLSEHQVEAMFDRIAGVYDLMNGVMTAGLHHRWRRRAADLAVIGPGDKVLDVATGTGDLAVELLSRVQPGGEVIGCDFSEQMLELARAKEPGISFQHADALALPYPDNSFKAATVGFGVRNYADLDRGLAELARVVEPGGHVVILEITTPERGVLAKFQRVWFDRIVPFAGKFAGDSDAYTYLPNSVRRFPGPEELASKMAGAGLGQIRYLITAGGIIALHVGVKH